MQPRISLITLGVSDFQKSLTFYRDGLKFPISSASVEGVVAFFQLGGLVLSLHPKFMLAEDAGASEPTGLFAGFTISHNVESEAAVDATLDFALAAGAMLQKPAQKTEWGGYHAYFSDPDGYLWEIAHNPFFPLDENGNVVLP